MNIALNKFIRVNLCTDIRVYSIFAKLLEQVIDGGLVYEHFLEKRWDTSKHAEWTGWKRTKSRCKPYKWVKFYLNDRLTVLVLVLVLYGVYRAPQPQVRAKAVRTSRTGPVAARASAGTWSACAGRPPALRSPPAAPGARPYEHRIPNIPPSKVHETLLRVNEKRGDSCAWF